MLELFDALFQKVTINWTVVALVIAGGFGQNAYLKYWMPFKKLPTDYNAAIRTLLVGLVITVVYFLIVRHSKDLVYIPGEFFVSYCIATSIYQVAIYPLVKKKITAVVGDTPADNKPDQ